MASFWLSFVLVIFIPHLVSSLSNEQKSKLDEIRVLLRRLEKEIDRMTYNDRKNVIAAVPRDNNDSDVTDNSSAPGEPITKPSAVTHDFYTETTKYSGDGDDNSSYETTTGSTGDKIGSTPALIETTIATIFDQDNTTEDQNYTTPINETFTESPELDRVSGSAEVQSSGGPTTPGVTELHFSTEVPKEKEEFGGSEEERELYEANQVRRLVDKGEDLERQLRGIFLELRSINKCVPLGEKCGLREMSKCCKGLKCDAFWSGNCTLDCVRRGKTCEENFFCCPGSSCVSLEDSIRGKTYFCQ